MSDRTQDLAAEMVKRGIYEALERSQEYTADEILEAAAEAQIQRAVEVLARG